MAVPSDPQDPILQAIGISARSLAGGKAAYTDGGHDIMGG